MSENKALEALRKIKIACGLGDTPPAPPAPAATDTPPASDAITDDAVVNQWAVDGGQPVFVNNSDDGMADIDKGDAVWLDEAMTQAYPDGTYKVTGTDFSFTVSAGKVSDVQDADGTGAGQPTAVEQPEDMSKKMADMAAELATVKASHAALLQEIASMKQGNAAFAKAEDVAKLNNILPQLLSLVEQLAEAPVAEPLDKQHGFKDERAANIDVVAAVANNLKSLRKAV